MVRMPVLVQMLAGLSAAAFLFAAPAAAETVKLGATLDGQQQVPSNDSPGKGTADVTFDTETRELAWTVEYAGLTGPVLSGHFHGPAEEGATAGVAVPFPDESLESPIQGSKTLTEQQAADLLAGKYYINLHTEQHQSGEIRGQVKKAM